MIESLFLLAENIVSVPVCPTFILLTMPHYSEEQRFFLVHRFEKYKKEDTKFFKRLLDDFKTEFPDCPKTPTYQGVQKMIRKANEFNSVANQGKGQTRTVRTPEKVEEVRSGIESDRDKARGDPSINTSRRNNFGLSHATFLRIAKTDLNLNAYKALQVPMQKPTDLGDRRDAATWYLSLTQEQQENIAFSDESIFSLDQGHNSQNDRRWAPKKKGDSGGRPESFTVEQAKYSKTTMVFLGLHSSGRFFGKRFFRGETVTGEKYYWHVRNNCVPALKALNPTNPGSLQGMIWQQDGASVHCTNQVMTYLGRQFGDRVWSRKAEQGVNWPSRSPDLNPLDYWVWAYLKSKVYFPKPQNLDQLESAISREIEILNSKPDLLKRVCGSLVKRTNAIIGNDTSGDADS